MKTILFGLKNSGLTPFKFASFSWPRYVARLPKGSLEKRLNERKNLHCGEYYHAPKPILKGAHPGVGFYLGETQTGMRWRWADEVCSSIRHKGGFCDTYQGDTIRGVVFRLPKSRGFLAGWSMGEGMASELDCRIFEDEKEAASCADNMAQSAAEEQIAY